jgi:hypothetical protein
VTTPQEKYHQNRLEQVKAALEANYFAASIHQTLSEAADHLIKTIIPEGPYKSVGFGGSATVAGSGLLQKLGAVPALEIIDRNDASLTPEKRTELSRQSLLVDLFVASSNALTLDGQLVNIDKFGNRVAALTFGPKKVALFVGRNKIVVDEKEAISRAKGTAAAMNALRLGQETPCAKKAKCFDCKAENRLCGISVITHRSFPKGRIHVLLVNEDLGF